MTDNPVDLAREVLNIQKAHEGMCKRTGLALPASLDDLETLASAAPDLARAVLRVAALAEECERDGVDEPWAGAPYGTFAARIRAALNGDPA